jgi:hypothetical protein
MLEDDGAVHAPISQEPGTGSDPASSPSAARLSYPRTSERPRDPSYTEAVRYPQIALHREQDRSVSPRRYSGRSPCSRLARRLSASSSRCTTSSLRISSSSASRAACQSGSLTAFTSGAYASLLLRGHPSGVCHPCLADPVVADDLDDLDGPKAAAVDAGRELVIGVAGPHASGPIGSLGAAVRRATAARAARPGAASTAARNSCNTATRRRGPGARRLLGPQPGQGRLLRSTAPGLQLEQRVHRGVDRLVARRPWVPAHP